MSVLLGELVARGLRAQTRTGNLLTGQLYIAIDFVPNEPRIAFDGAVRPLRIPTAPGTLDHAQEQISSIVAKLDALPRAGRTRHRAIATEHRHPAAGGPRLGRCAQDPGDGRRYALG